MFTVKRRKVIVFPNKLQMKFSHIFFIPKQILLILVNNFIFFKKSFIFAKRISK